MVAIRLSALVALALASAPALADQQPKITMEGVARSVSQLIAIRSACGEYYNVDKELLTKMITATIEAGFKIYNKQQFLALESAEIERRRDEVDLTGRSQWCTYQRGYWRNTPALKIFRN